MSAMPSPSIEAPNDKDKKPQSKENKDDGDNERGGTAVLTVGVEAKVAGLLLSKDEAHLASRLVFEDLNISRPSLFPLFGIL